MNITSWGGIDFKKNPNALEPWELATLLAMYMRNHCDERGYVRQSIKYMLINMFGDYHEIKGFTLKKARGWLRSNGFYSTVDDNGIGCWVVPKDILDNPGSALFVDLAKKPEDVKKIKKENIVKTVSCPDCSVVVKASGIAAHRRKHVLGKATEELLDAILKNPGRNSAFYAKELGISQDQAKTRAAKLRNDFQLIKTVGKTKAAKWYPVDAVINDTPIEDVPAPVLNSVDKFANRRERLSEASKRRAKTMVTCSDCGKQMTDLGYGPHRSRLHPRSISDKTQSLINEIVKNPGLRPHEYDEALGWHHGAASYWGNEAVKKNKIYKRGRGKGTRFFAYARVKANRNRKEAPVKQRWPQPVAPVVAPTSANDVESITVIMTASGEALTVKDGKWYRVVLEEVAPAIV